MPSTPTGAVPIAVLVVDDEEGVRMLAARMLREGGYAVQTAADGAEALALVLGAATPVDVVITDLKMPRMDGEALAHRVIAHDPACRFVFISGHPGLGALPGPLLSKPFRAEELLAAVEAAVHATSHRV